MASNKRRLGKLIGGSEPPAAREPIQKGTPFQVSTTAAPAEVELAGRLAELPAPLQEIARRYVGARRRSGEALLEAARWLSEARATAEHGEWQLFLDATGTSADAAERLQNIHRTAMQNQQFADAVARNWLGQSVAALLARPSTPPEVVAELLGQETAPQVEDVRAAMARARPSRRARGEAQIPQFAEFAPAVKGTGAPEEQPGPVAAAGRPAAPVSADLALEVLHEATRAVEGLCDLAPHLRSPAAWSLLHRLKQAIQVLEERTL